MSLIRKDMNEKKTVEIFKEFSTGLSNRNWYRETPCVIYFECSPSDGVQMVVTSDKAKKVEKLFTKWLTLNDLECLKKCIDDSIKFYKEIEVQNEQ